MQDFQVPLPAPRNSVLVIGFLGGFDDWNDSHRSIRKVALDLRSLALPGVYVETIGNHRRALALKLIDAALSGGSHRNGPRWEGEAQSRSGIRIILYGQSWGGAAVVSTARDLQRLGVSVQLTVQVDSVGLGDDVVPANVRKAANIFQRDPFGIRGCARIRAEDPAATEILENTKFSYLFRSYSTLNRSDTSWARRAFGGGHAKMEADPVVWRHVEALILEAIER